MDWNSVVTVLLCIPPLALAGAGAAGVWFLMSLRASLRGRGRVPGWAAALTLAWVSVMHVGYFLAPWVWGTPARWWAVGLMAPAALVTLGAIWLTPMARTMAKIDAGMSVRVRLLSVGVLALPPVLYGVPLLAVAVMERAR